MKIFQTLRFAKAIDIFSLYILVIRTALKSCFKYKVRPQCFTTDMTLFAVGFPTLAAPLLQFLFTYKI